MLDRHLDDLRLLNAATAFFEVGGGDEAAQVRQAVVHPNNNNNNNNRLKINFKSLWGGFKGFNIFSQENFFY